MSDTACVLRGMRWDGGVEYSGGSGGYVLHRVRGPKLEILLHWGKSQEQQSQADQSRQVKIKIKF